MWFNRNVIKKGQLKISFLLCMLFESLLWCAIFILFMVSWSFSAFGCIIGIYATSWDQIALFSNFVFMPLTFLGGIFYSINDLPNNLELISKFNPLYWMINGLRFSTLNIYDTSPFISIIIIIFSAIIFTLIATIMFATGYRIKE